MLKSIIFILISLFSTFAFSYDNKDTTPSIDSINQQSVNLKTSTDSLINLNNEIKSISQKSTNISKSLDEIELNIKDINFSNQLNNGVFALCGLLFVILISSVIYILSKNKFMIIKEVKIDNDKNKFSIIKNIKNRFDLIDDYIQNYRLEKVILKRQKAMSDEQEIEENIPKEIVNIIKTGNSVNSSNNKETVVAMSIIEPKLDIVEPKINDDLEIMALELYDNNKSIVTDNKLDIVASTKDKIDNVSTLTLCD